MGRVIFVEIRRSGLVLTGILAHTYRDGTCDVRLIVAPYSLRRRIPYNKVFYSGTHCLAGKNVDFVEQEKVTTSGSIKREDHESQEGNKDELTASY